MDARAPVLTSSYAFVIQARKANAGALFLYATRRWWPPPAAASSVSCLSERLGSQTSGDGLAHSLSTSGPSTAAWLRPLSGSRHSLQGACKNLNADRHDQLTDWISVLCQRFENYKIGTYILPVGHVPKDPRFLWASLTGFVS